MCLIHLDIITQEVNGKKLLLTCEEGEIIVKEVILVCTVIPVCRACLSIRADVADEVGPARTVQLHPSLPPVRTTATTQ